MSKDKYVGKVLMVYLPNNKRPRFRWIVRKREDGRYIARAPKIGVLIRDLNKKLDKDFNKEQLLPKDFTFRESSKSKKKSNKSSKSNNTKKSKK